MEQKPIVTDDSVFNKFDTESDHSLSTKSKNWSQPKDIKT